MEDGYMRPEDFERFDSPCWRCGKSLSFLTKNPILRPFCDECEKAHEAEKSERLQEYIRLKMHVMHERALRMLEKQQIGIAVYREAANAVLEFALEDCERFASSHEMIAAMELIRSHVKVKVQQKILKHRVDFVIPELKVILEIDGYMHDYSELKDSKRDIDVRAHLGGDWEIVRIPTKYLEQNAGKLLDAIYAVREEKKKIRSANNGIIPEWYSRRERSRYRKLSNTD